MSRISPLALMPERAVQASLAPQGRKRRPWTRYSTRTFYLFISPWLLGFLGLTVAPLLYALFTSFTNFDGISTAWHWVGFANYQEAFRDPDTWYSLGRTVLYTGIVVPLSIAGGLGLAVLLNRRLFAVGLLRTIFYAPSIIPVVASAIVWQLIFDRNAGVANALVEALGGHAVSWLLDPTVFFALIVMVLWGLGGGMVLSLAGLQGVPQELIEAARVDGANALQSFLRITLPILSPILFFQAVTGVIYALQTLIQPLLLAQSKGIGHYAGTIQRSNYLYMVHVYEQFFANQRFGYGSALLWILFVVILIITLLVFRSSTFWVYYEVDQA